jgi:hypothetical protein
VSELAALERTLRASPSSIGDIPELPWPDFLAKFRREYTATRDNAQNITILGPIGTGKSTLAMELAKLRPYVFVLGTKPRDEHMRRMLRAGGYRKVDVLPEAGSGVRRVYIWPPNKGKASRANQRKMFGDAFQHQFETGVWHGVIDEGHYVAHELGLTEDVRVGYQQLRSNGAGFILCAQRPAWLPPDIYSSANHLFLFGTNDSNDLKRISGLNGVNDRTVRDAVQSLRRDKRFVHVNTDTGELTISRLTGVSQ